MVSLDDCSRLELKRLARFSTPAQIAEAKARIAREAANRENEERLRVSAAAVEAARAVKSHFERFGGATVGGADRKAADEDYRRLFDAALLASRRSQHASKRWVRFEAQAQKLERAARRIREDERAVGLAQSARQEERAVGLDRSERQ